MGGAFGRGGEDPTQVIVSIPARFEPKNGFDPLMNWGWDPSPHKPLIQSTLVSYEQGKGFVGDLAESFSCVDNGLTWVFSLRQDAVFTNGRQVVANDVVFTIESLLSSPDVKIDLSSVVSIEALDSSSVAVRLTRPDYSVLASLSTIGIVPSAEYGESYGSNPIGSGMYKMTQWDPKVKAILDYNEGYYGKKPSIRRIVVVFEKGSRSFSNSRTGDLDIGYLDIEATSPTVVYGNPRLEILPNGLSLSTRTPEGYFLSRRRAVDVIGLHLPVKEGASVSNDGFIANDPAIRQAVSLSINRDELVLKGLLGYGCAATSACDFQDWSIGPLSKGEFNPERACEILDNAGWKSVDLNGFRTKAGQRATLLFSYFDSDSVIERIAELVKRQVEAVGIQVVLVPLIETIERPAVDTSTVETNPTITRYGSLHPWEMMRLYDEKSVSPELKALSSEAYAAQSYSQMTSAVQAYQKAASASDDYSYIWLVNVERVSYQRQNLNALSEPLLQKWGGWGMFEHVDDWGWVS